jgi:hypothetical protein
LRGLIPSLLLAAILPPAAGATAQPAPAGAASASDPAEDSGDIIVVGDNGQSYSLTADALRDAVRAFRAHRAAYAPDAVFYFRASLTDGDVDGLDLYLRRRRGAANAADPVHLERDPAGYYRVPIDLVADGDWELRANRARSALQLRPLILSPASRIADRRFGDLRLQCRVAIAFARLGLPARMAVGALGPCGSSRVALYMRADRPVASVSITGYSGTIALREDAMAIRVPLADAAITNEDRLRITYR